MSEADLPSGKEFFEAARKELGYNRKLEFIGELMDGPTTMQKIEDLSMHFDGNLDWLSLRIAVDAGLATEIAPGVVKYKPSHRFQSPEEREIMRQEFGPSGPETQEPLHAMIRAPHIEEAEKSFYVRFTRAPFVNEYLHPEANKVIKVMAQTETGTLEVAKYHYGRLGQDFWVEQRQACEMPMAHPFPTVSFHAGDEQKQAEQHVRTSEIDESTPTVNRLARLLQQGIEVPKINPASERGTPMQAKQITHGIEIEL